MLRIHHVLYKAKIQTMESKLWSLREKQSKQPVFTIVRKGKNKKVITNCPSRKIRSRE